MGEGTGGHLIRPLGKTSCLFAASSAFPSGPVETLKTALNLRIPRNARGARLENATQFIIVARLPSPGMG